jgi:ankyrin repeat protein
MDTLDFFQQEGRGFICYTNLLPRYMPNHPCTSINRSVECKSLCALTRLLQLGANPDPRGFQVTPLQMATFRRDAAGVRALLEAGADPNNTGDGQGIEWAAETSIFQAYCGLHGFTPLYVLRHLEGHPEIPRTIYSEEGFEYMTSVAGADIERLLLNYNAVECV